MNRHHDKYKNFKWAISLSKRYVTLWHKGRDVGVLPYEYFKSQYLDVSRKEATRFMKLAINPDWEVYELARIQRILE